MGISKCEAESKDGSQEEGGTKGLGAAELLLKETRKEAG
jgi:hypothetical protein